MHFEKCFPHLNKNNYIISKANDGKIIRWRQLDNFENTEGCRLLSTRSAISFLN